MERNNTHFLIDTCGGAHSARPIPHIYSSVGYCVVYFLQGLSTTFIWINGSQLHTFFVYKLNHLLGLRGVVFFMNEDLSVQETNDDVYEMTKEEVVDAIVEFNNDPDVHRLRNIYYNQNIAEIFAVSRRELSHSSFLAWLFTMSANHMLGNLPIIQLLELYILKSREQHKKYISDLLYTAIITRNIQILDTAANTEEAVTAKEAKGRADIVIDCDAFLSKEKLGRVKIVIENKVYSSEHSHQTKTYHEHYERVKETGEEVLYIYLTPPSISSGAECPNFVHITYQDLLEHVLHPLMQTLDINQRTLFILNEYINCLSVPSDVVDDKNNSRIQTSILAIGMEEKELLQKFWEKYDKLIMASINAYAISSGDKDAQELSEKLNKRDMSKYTVDGKGKYGKNRMVEAVILAFLEKNRNTTVEQLKAIFPDSLQGSLGVIRSTADNIKDKSRYFAATHCTTNETFFICNQWGTQTVRFIDYVNNSNEINIRIEKFIE